MDAGDDDPEAVAEETRRRYFDTDYDFVSEWPVRMAVVRRGDELTHMVAVLCHFVTDGFGSQAMIAHVTGRTPPDPGELWPLGQARWQRGPAGRRQTEAVLRHWEAILRAATPNRFAPVARPDDGPRFADATYASPAMALAVPVVAARHGTDTAAVLLAAFAVALVRVTGVNPVVSRVIVHNRFRPGLARVVALINQTGLFAVDLDGVTLGGALARAARAGRTATKYAYYDPTQVDALIARVSRDRGVDVDLQVFFNDRRLGERLAPNADAPDPAAVTRAAEQSVFTWTAAGDGPGERLFLHVEDDHDAVVLSATADTHHLSRADAEAVLRGMQDAVLDLWADPDGSVR
ncbi:condensation domain-containing protein [Luedemannella flava]